MDDPNDWEKRKRENKRQRRAEGYRKIRKEMYKDAIKNGVVRESVLINRKLREKNHLGIQTRGTLDIHTWGKGKEE